MACTRAALAAEQHRWIGYKEQPPGSNNTVFGKEYGLNPAAWCDMFQSVTAKHVGGSDIVGRFAYTPSHAQWFVKQGRFGQTPLVGAIVFFNFGNPHYGGRFMGIQHVGLVVGILKDGRVVCREGNTDNMVADRVRSRSNIAGYGYPKYLSPPATPKPTPSPPAKKGAPAWPGKLLKHGSVGGSVRTLQARLRARGWKIDVDGIFGAGTEKVVRAFQKDKKLQVDGVVGRITWNKLWTTRITE